MRSDHAGRSLVDGVAINPAITMYAIDVHAHFGDYDAGAGSGALVNRLFGGGIDVVRRRAQAAGVRLTVVSALTTFMPYGGNPFKGNDESRSAAEKHDDICFWAVLDPRLKESYRQVEALLAHPRCKGIKIHPQRHFYEIRQYGDEVFSFAAGNRAVVLTHSGDPGSFPEDFIPFTDRHSQVRLILAHLGNNSEAGMSRQVCAVQRSQAGNVFIDTSSARSIYSGLIEWAVETIGADRLLFGTDTPLYSVACHKARIESAEISQAAKRAILFRNAARLLNEPVKQFA